MRTPMKATGVTDGSDTLVMNGVGGDAGGIKGQIKYQARVKVIAQGGVTFVGSLRIRRGPGVPEADLSGAERRGGIFRGHVAGRSQRPVARHQSVHFAGERTSVWFGGLRRGRRWTSKSCATFSPTPSRRRKFSGWTRSSPGNSRRPARFAPNQIGGAGQLQEWWEDWDMRAPEMAHRHVSHLSGLYPGRDIHRRDTPELTAAA